jgi:hypothetical protein
MMKSNEELSDYRDFIESREMESLVRTNNIRMHEEITRPRVEIWPDEDGWDQWVLSHEEKRRSLLCNLSSMSASPFCALGHH